MITPDLYWYAVTIDRVIDGDTVDARVDLGFHISQLMRFRLARINAPEMRGSERKAGQAAKQFLIDLLAEERWTQILALTEKDKSDSFGRYIATLFGVDATGTVYDFCSMMVGMGHAVWKEY